MIAILSRRGRWARWPAFPRYLFVGLAVAAVIAYPRSGDASTPNLVAAYGFEEGQGSSTADASGNGNNGTLVNAAWSSAGKFGDALSFNGTS
ncbi:MAG TPA: hypothetical protein VGH82_02840, partial [Gaiellaceae bacterium]